MLIKRGPIRQTMFSYFYYENKVFLAKGAWPNAPHKYAIVSAPSARMLLVYINASI